MKGIAKNSSKAVGLAGVLVTISDLMQPIAPVAAYVCAASFASFFIFWLAKKIKNEWRENLSVCMFFSAGLWVLSSALYFYQNSDEVAKSKGFIASSSSVFESMQYDLGLIGDGVRNVEVAVRENTSAVREIADAVREAKRETSLDPMKELANKGVDWSYNNFRAALYEKHYEVSELFAMGGMKISGADLNEYLWSLHDERNGEIILKYNAINTGGDIPSVSEYLSYYETQSVDPVRVEIMRHVYGVDNLKDKFDEALEIEAANIKDAIAFNRDRENSWSRCVNKLGNLELYHFYDLVEENPGSNGFVTTGDQAEEAMFYDIYRELYVGDVDKLIKEGYIKELAHKACAAVNKERATDTGKLDAIKQMRRVYL